MKVLSENMKINGEVPEGCVQMECEICKEKYAVPGGEINEYNPPICSGCAASVQTQMNTTTTSDVINKVGDLSSPADKATQI